MKMASVCSSSAQIGDIDPKLSLQKCISALKVARNDNERFATLLLVTQLVHSNSIDSSGRKSLFDAVGFNFINRLLRSRNVPSECPQDVYRSLALAILACFATDEEFLLHPEMVSKIPVFLAGILKEEENEAISRDCSQILISLASTSTGCSHLLEKEAFSTLCQIASDATEANSNKAVEIVIRIVSSSPNGVWSDRREILFEVLKALCKRFKETQDSTKFEFCNFLVLLLARAERLLFKENENNGWLEDVYTGVKEILQSKVSSAQRDPAIILVSLVIELVGMDWMIGSVEQDSGLFVLCTTIASIETRMILDGNNLAEVIPKTTVLVSCYNILEKAIDFAVVKSGTTGASDVQPLPKLLSKSLPKLYSIATEAVQSIIQFLETVACIYNKEVADEQSSELVYASVRVLCAWMAEETSALQDSICKLLPFLLKLARESLDSSTDCLLDTRTSETGMFSSNAASHVSTVGVPNLIEERLFCNIDVMRFLLPPLCHLSADEKMRKILIDHEGLVLLSKYFFQMWKIWNGQAKDDAQQLEAETCLLTLLGILLNFAVTENRLSVNNHEFQEIGQHAVASVPLLLPSERNAVIIINLLVLGLLFLRSCVQHNITVNTEALSKFLQASIYILKEARPFVHDDKDKCVEDGRSQFATRCKLVWVDIAELWFLALQLVSALCGPLPVTRELLKESGWIETIVTHFNTNIQDQQLSADEKTALLDLIHKVNNY